MGIDSIQLNSVLRSVLRRYLEDGKVPSFADVIRDAKFLLPSPGKPYTKLSPVARGSVIDDEEYNTWWDSVLSDLTTVFEATLEGATSLSRGIWDVVTTSEQLRQKLNNVRQQAAAVRTRRTEPVKLVERFSSMQQINIDYDHVVGASNTTALIDVKQGVATLPPITGYSRVVDATAASTVVEVPKDIFEAPIAGAGPGNLVDGKDDTMWATELYGGGGGAACKVTITLPSPSFVDTIEVHPSREQTTVVSAVIDNSVISFGSYDTSNLISIDVSGTLSKLVMTITQTTGEPTGNRFKYVVGIRNVTLITQDYSESAIVTLRPLEIPEEMTPTGGGCIGVATLSVMEDKPEGTSVRYEISSTDSPGAWYEISPLAPAILNERIYSSAVASGWETVPGVSGTPLYTSGDMPHQCFPNALLNSFFYTNGVYGVYAGDLQWKVDSYPYSWEWDPGHLPGPDDWSVLPPGVEPHEVNTIYSDIFTDEPTTPELGSAVTINNSYCTMAENRNYRWSISFYCKEAQEATALSSLVTLDAAGEVLVSTYLNDRVVTPTFVVDPLEEDGHQYFLKAGWNTLRIYIWCKDASATSEYTTGLNIAPSVDAAGPNSNIVYTMSSSTPLVIANLFDLKNNTPFLTVNRVALDIVPSDANTPTPYSSYRPVLPWNPLAIYRRGLNGSDGDGSTRGDMGDDCRIMGRYILVPPSPTTYSGLVLRATLSRPPASPSVRPKILEVSLEVQ